MISGIMQLAVPETTDQIDKKNQWLAGQLSPTLRLTISGAAGGQTSIAIKIGTARPSGTCTITVRCSHLGAALVLDLLLRRPPAAQLQQCNILYTIRTQLYCQQYSILLDTVYDDSNDLQHSSDTIIHDNGKLIHTHLNSR